MKILNLTTLVATTLTLTSSLAFARGHDIPERYEWEAQIDKIQETERTPSSESPAIEIEGYESFKEHYTNKED